MKLKSIIVTAIFAAIVVFPFTNTFASLTSSNAVKETRNLPEFTSIELICSADLFITQGNTQEVVVEADGELMSHFFTEVENGTLRVYIKNYRKNIHTAKVYVTVSNLENVSIVGSGDMTFKDVFKTNDFKIKIVGSGDLIAPLDAKNVIVSIAGSGDVKLSGIRGSLQIDVGGSGDTYAKDLTLTNCELSVAGSGDVVLEGSTAKFIVSIAGSGDIQGENLKAVDVQAKIAGSGDVEITAIESLIGSIIGSGSLYYHGNPSKATVNTVGSGRAIQK